MTAPTSGRHSVGAREPVDDPLSHTALQREIDTNRRAEFRLLIWTATSMAVVAILIVVHLLWL